MRECAFVRERGREIKLFNEIRKLLSTFVTVYPNLGFPNNYGTRNELLSHKAT